MDPRTILKYSAVEDFPLFFNNAVVDTTPFQIDCSYINEIPTPIPHTVSAVGTDNSKTWGYKTAYETADGKITEVNDEVTTAAGCTTLSAADYNAIVSEIDGEDVKFVRFYRTTCGAASTPATTGLIARLSVDGAVGGQLTYNDTGGAGDSSTPPATNNTRTRSVVEGCHRLIAFNYGGADALIHLCRARNATVALAKATRDFAVGSGVGFDGTTKLGRSVPMVVGSSCDLLVPKGIGYITLVTASATKILGFLGRA